MFPFNARYGIDTVYVTLKPEIQEIDCVMNKDSNMSQLKITFFIVNYTSTINRHVKHFFKNHTEAHGQHSRKIYKPVNWKILNCSV